MKALLSLIMLSTVLYHSNAENLQPRVSISGHIKDASNGEVLIGATVTIRELGLGAASNVYGFYSISLAPGTYTAVYSYMGYASEERKVTLSAHRVVNVELKPQTAELDAVVISSSAPNANVTRAEMSVNRLDIKSIQRIPALMGEVDVIKAIQMLPGVQTIAEGSSGYSVRGGSADHNLVLIDEAPVYNAGHILGFFSIFNNDAVRDVKLYKGDIPASHGGRLASLLDVRMKDGNSKEFSGTGGIGSISSRLTLEGPILSENTTFLVSGRRTYADLFLPFARDTNLHGNQLFFYDLNLKLSHRLNDKNRLFVSGYFGRDVFSASSAGFGYGNQTLTARWNHVITPSLFLNVTGIFSSYDYYLGSPSNQTSSFIWRSNMEDYSLKLDFTLFANSRNTMRFGAESIYHFINPGVAKGTGDNSIIGDIVMPNDHSLEHAVYAMNEQSVGERINLRYGLRFSALQNIGPAKVFEYDENQEPTGEYREYSRNEFFNTYANLEPRLSAAYAFSGKHSVKASYSRTVQYIQQASNSAAGTPLDIWFTSSPNVKPQLSDLIAAGYFRNFLDNRIETSVELYYRSMRNVIDFKDFANMLLNEKLEAELRFGTAQAYGVEFMARFDFKKLNGWASYTYSRAHRTIRDINYGRPYNAPYDKPHDVSIVLNYVLNPKLTFSANWLYSTGMPATFPTGRYEVLGTLIPIYSNRGDYRYPDYHRLDLGITYRPAGNAPRRWFSEWNLSVYNAYYRKNAWTINFVQDRANPNITKAELTYLFPILPSLTYNFKF